MDKKFIPFIKCRHPTKVHTFSGDIMCGCGKCDLCRDAKSQRYNQQLQREEGSHLYNFFVTLTYSPEWLPLYELVDKEKYIGFYGRVETAKGIMSEEIQYDTLSLPLTEVSFKPCFARLYPIRGTQKFEVRDAGEDYETIEVSSFNLATYLDRYYKHLAKYKNEYCQTNFEFHKGFVALAPKRDLETFLIRFKNYAYRKCNKATFRYFAVPDYGTQGLAPHWHILFFTDSSELASAFTQDVKNYGTRKRPSFAATFLSELWRYGIVNSQRVEKSCASYVSSYLNAPDSFPSLLRDTFRQRAYHSLHLGAVLKKEEVYESLSKGDFERFTKVRYSDNEGFVSTYEWSRKDFIGFLPSLPYIGRTSLLSYESLCLEVLGFIRKCKAIDPDVTFKTISYALYDHVSSSKCSLSLCDYLNIQNCFGSFYKSDINLFYSIVLSVHRIYKVMTSLSFTFTQYCDLLCRFEKWYGLRQLNFLYTSLANDIPLANEYYLNLSDDYEKQFYRPIGLAALGVITTRLEKNVKHRKVAELYRFN